MRKATAAMLGLLLTTGCLTRAGGALAPLEPAPPAETGTVEYAIGSFEFTLEGGKMVTSNKAGRDLSKEILKRWKKRAYITDFSYADENTFTGDP